MISRPTASLALLLVAAGCAQTPEPEVARTAPEPVEIDAEARACLAEAIYFEARGTSEAGQAAVAHVVLNRAEHPKFPDTVCGVVADGCQFSYRCDGLSEVLANPAARAEAVTIAENVLTSDEDITGGALFFHADWVNPRWFQTRPRIGRFGGNIFYR